MIVRVLLALVLLAAHQLAAAYPAVVSNPPGHCTAAPCYTYYTPAILGAPGAQSNTPEGSCAPVSDNYTAGGNSSWRGGGSSPVFNVRTPATPNASSWVNSAHNCRLTLTGINQNAGNTSTADGPISWATRAPDPVLYTCPSGGTLSNGQCVCSAEETDTGSACEANVCQQGTTTQLNPTTGHGWITGFDDGLAIVKGAPGRVSGDGNTAPPTLCDGQCTMTATGPASEYWVSKDPSATGMHRISVVQTYTRTGAKCSTPSADLDATTTASCPGTMGSFNGKPVCLSTSTTDTGSGGGTPLKPGSNIGNNPGSGPVPEADKVGADGQLGGGTSKPPSNAGGGSTPGTPGGVVVGGGSSTRTVTRSDGTTETEEITWGDVTEGKAEGVPKIYTRKYDKGPGDYFNEKMAAVSGKGASFITAAFAPPWSDNPALCPKWTLPGASIGPWELGFGDVSVPCNVWAFCRIVIILSALFLARALVFGG